MSKATIQIAYDGEDVVNGTMNARELAPALLGISNLLEDANRVMNGDETTANVLIRSDFRSGSFEITLDLIQTLAKATKAMIGIIETHSAKEIAELIGVSAGCGISLLKLVKWLKGRKITKATTIDNGRIRIETEQDFDSLEVSDQVIRLYRDRKVRESLNAVLHPLQRQGIDKFIVREGNNEVETINKSEKEYFEVPLIPDEEITESTRKAAFNVVGVFFEENLKWKLFDGDNRINASILDKGFLEQIEKGNVSFTKGDILEVELRTRQWKTTSGLRTEHEITKVIKQHKAFDQLPLPFSES